MEINEPFMMAIKPVPFGNVTLRSFAKAEYTYQPSCSRAARFDADWVSTMLG